MPSTAIRAFAYDRATRTLEVTFVTGRRYRFAEVPEDVIEAFRGAFAKGRFFNARIRQRFRSWEIDGGEEG